MAGHEESRRSGSRQPFSVHFDQGLENRVQENDARHSGRESEGSKGLIPALDDNDMANYGPRPSKTREEGSRHLSGVSRLNSNNLPVEQQKSRVRTAHQDRYHDPDESLSEFTFDHMTHHLVVIARAYTAKVTGPRGSVAHGPLIHCLSALSVSCLVNLSAPLDRIMVEAVEKRRWSSRSTELSGMGTRHAMNTIFVHRFPTPSPMCKIHTTQTSRLDLRR